MKILMESVKCLKSIVTKCNATKIIDKSVKCQDPYNSFGGCKNISIIL